MRKPISSTHSMPLPYFGALRQIWRTASATATKAIVEAAIAYFIEYKTAEEAKNILSERMPKQK